MLGTDINFTRDFSIFKQTIFPVHLKCDSNHIHPLHKMKLSYKYITNLKSAFYFSNTSNKVVNFSSNKDVPIFIIHVLHACSKKIFLNERII